MASNDAFSRTTINLFCVSFSESVRGIFLGLWASASVSYSFLIFLFPFPFAEDAMIHVGGWAPLRIHFFLNRQVVAGKDVCSGSRIFKEAACLWNSLQEGFGVQQTSTAEATSRLHLFVMSGPHYHRTRGIPVGRAHRQGIQLVQL